MKSYLPVHLFSVSRLYFSCSPGISPGGWAFRGNFDGGGGAKNHFRRSGMWMGGCCKIFGIAFPQPSFNSCPNHSVFWSFAIHRSASLERIKPKSAKKAYFRQQKATKAQFLPRIFSSSVLGYIIFIDVSGPKGPNFCSRSFSLRLGLIEAMKTFVELGSPYKQVEQTEDKYIVKPGQKQHSVSEDY